MTKAFSFAGIDWPKIGRGALVAITGALIAWLPTVTTDIDWGVYAPFVTAGVAVLVNVLRKFASPNV